MSSQKLAFIIIASFLMIALFVTDVNAEVQFIITVESRCKTLEYKYSPVISTLIVWFKLEVSSQNTTSI